MLEENKTKQKSKTFTREVTIYKNNLSKIETIFEQICQS